MFFFFSCVLMFVLVCSRLFIHDRATKWGVDDVLDSVFVFIGLDVRAAKVVGVVADDRVASCVPG